MIRSLPQTVAFVATLLTFALVPRWWCGRDAGRWLDGEQATQTALADEMVAFEERDDRERLTSASPGDRFAGEWALVTHQMTALGLGQVVLAHPSLRDRYVGPMSRAAAKSFLPEMRDFGTRAWGGEDALASVGSTHGHAYLAYSALAVSMARLFDTAFPPELARQHDALVTAYTRRLDASSTGLIETYPGEAYPTDVAAVAAAIALHARATGRDRREMLRRWSQRVRAHQIDGASGLVVQRVGARDGKAHDAPRGSGTGLAAYYAGFVDRALARDLTRALARHESTLLGFGAIREYAAGHKGGGDVDSGPVVLGVSVAATGFALSAFRAHGLREPFERVYRTTDLFGLPHGTPSGRRFATGGAIGNALLLAMLTSGPELAP